MEAEIKERYIELSNTYAQEATDVAVRSSATAEDLADKSFAGQQETYHLTQLTLGLDRDSAIIASIYDERNKAVKRMISMLIKTAKQHGVKVGICGQAPSDFPDFAQFLTNEAIDSISVTPDSVLKTIRALQKGEIFQMELMKTKNNLEEPY